MRRESRRYRGVKTTTLIVLMAIAYFLGYYIGGMNEVIIINYNQTRPANVVTYVPYISENASSSSIVVPAVDEEGEGLTTVLSVQIVPGSGKILANIDRLLFWTDTQNSIRTSTKVASNITGINLSDYDVIYTIETEATAVEGPSAGAALTIATIAALKKEKLNPEVMITGAINHDGTIGPVGEILPKAKAAKEAGAKILLVPLLHSKEVTYKTKKYCEQIGISQICTTENIPTEVSISEEVGIEVAEVRTIEDAMDYFLAEG
ncbi:MAG: hypothetical protein GTN38_00115 [Candidatus Aenigmarchaeota archaeon]|nr:hypothetical protein [Candidatus Aenigmarchaeota archaeon]NIP39909.1 hypothetical protein [Candidatus Aenigmarchaeota archaeon]NIQ17628.1 hypothetical protein [Candidatus Aenigmarchaeota archaeon]NIS72816.1 hypothetical protein [Candidatus Aenigmarchaeota archaeon]